MRKLLILLTMVLFCSTTIAIGQTPKPDKGPKILVSGAKVNEWIGKLEKAAKSKSPKEREKLLDDVKKEMTGDRLKEDLPNDGEALGKASSDDTKMRSEGKYLFNDSIFLEGMTGNQVISIMNTNNLWIYYDRVCDINLSPDLLNIVQCSLLAHELVHANQNNTVTTKTDSTDLKKEGERIGPSKEEVERPAYDKQVSILEAAKMNAGSFLDELRIGKVIEDCKAGFKSHTGKKY